MRNKGKAMSLESKFPLLAMEHNCIVSKYADFTACFRVHLPELFTVALAEYDAIHSAWHKAINTLLNDYGDVELQNSAVPFNIVLVKFFVVYRK